MRNWLWIALAAAAAAPGPYFRLMGLEATPELQALTFGIAILGAAFLLSWAAEAAETEISQALALAVLALIAVLPEYAVDMVLAWKAGTNPVYAHYATANMTGSNRLLIGIAWPLIFFLFWLKTRQRLLHLEEGHALELGVLTIATLYAFTIPIKAFFLGGSLTLIDTLILVSLFAAYIWLASRAPSEEPELVGPAQSVGELPQGPRRLAIAGMFLWSAVSIFAAAEPFADSLIETGHKLGIDEFLLIQWLAPLASEAPEVIVAALFVLRGRAGAAMGTVISSKVNQWTLLVGTLPVVYAISHRGIGGLPLDGRQTEEILLTAAQSAFAVLVLARLRFSPWGAAVLLVLFSAQLLITAQAVRYGFAGAYLLLAMGILLLDRERPLRLARVAAQVIAANGRRVRETTTLLSNPQHEGGEGPD